MDRASRAGRSGQTSASISTWRLPPWPGRACRCRHGCRDEVVGQGRQIAAAGTPIHPRKFPEVKHTLTLLTALLLAPLAALHAADFILVDKGTPPAPIIVSKDASPRTRDAAVTLAEYIEKISGAKPAVMDGETQPVPERGDLDRSAAGGEGVVSEDGLRFQTTRRKP